MIFFFEFCGKFKKKSRERERAKKKKKKKTKGVRAVWAVPRATTWQLANDGSEEYGSPHMKGNGGAFTQFHFFRVLFFWARGSHIIL